MTEPALVPPPSQESDPSLRPSEGGPDLMEEAHPALTTASPESVRTATLAGVRWGVMARFGIETASFLSTVILARLINPAGFGHAATALAIIAIATGLTVEGFGTPLVQRKNVLRAHVEVSLLLSVTSGLAMTVLVFLLAPLLTGALGHENVALIQLASPAFFAVSLCAIPQALQQRRLNFRATSLIEVSSLGVGVAGSIVLAVAGLGARALVLGQILIPISASVMYLAVTPLMFPRWHRREARDIVGFGSRTTLSSLLFSAYSNIDYVVVSWKLGARATGFYWRAFQIGGVYQGKISEIMLRLALPIYSRTRDLDDMRRIRRRIVRVHATVIFPLLATYVVLAPVLVPLVFGKAWGPAIVPSQILAFGGMIYALGTGGAALVLAAGRPTAALVSNLVQLCAYVAVVIVFARYGLNTLCLAVVATIGLSYLATYYVLFDRMIGIPMRQLWEEIAPATVSMIPLFVFAVPVAHLLTAASTPRLLWIPAVGATAVAAYLISLSLGFRDAWADVLILVRHIRRPKRDSSAEPQPGNTRRHDVRT